MNSLPMGALSSGSKQSLMHDWAGPFAGIERWKDQQSNLSAR